MKKLALVPSLMVWLLLGSRGYGQQADIAFGVSGLKAPTSTTNSQGVFLPSIGGGTYLTVSGDFLIKHNFGLNVEVSWRAHRFAYGGFEPVRPLFYDFNGIWAPRFTKYAGVDLMAGIGAASLRFYTPYYNCSYFGCTNYSSSNHFLADFGGGIRLYPRGNFFVRPEAHLYLINNNQEFSSGRVARVGVSIGYTFGGKYY